MGSQQTVANAIQPQSEKTRTPANHSEFSFAPPSRLMSLDFFRGFTMFLLIAESTGIYDLLIAPEFNGTFIGAIGTQFHHHPWNGLRFWDLAENQDPGYRRATRSDHRLCAESCDTDHQAYLHQFICYREPWLGLAGAGFFLLADRCNEVSEMGQVFLLCRHEFPVHLSVH